MGLRTILTGVGMSVCALTAANAADVGGFKDSPYVAAAGNWSGLYVGWTAGYGMGSSVTDYNNTQGVQTPDGNHPWTHNDPSGVLAGLTVGYNYQLNDRWMAGVEGDLSVTDISGKDNMKWGDGHRWHTGWPGLATLRARVGWEWDPMTVIYGTGGLAVLASNEYNIGDNADQSSDNTGWKWGWVVGFGVERAFSDRWSGKIEYLHVGLPDNAGYGENDGGYIYKNDLDLIRVGMNYKIR